MSRRDGWAAIGLAGIIAAVVALGATFPESLTTSALAIPPDAQIAERTAVCPVLRNVADGVDSVTTFVAPEAQSADGRIEGASESPLPLPPPGQATRVVPPGTDATVSVTAAGPAAASTSTVRDYLDAGDEGRGLALASCVEPRADWWFVGVSADQGHLDELLMGNSTGSPAVVTVDVYGPAGQIDVLGVGGVVVQPGEQSVIRVDSLIPGVSTATLHVSTSGGLIAAAVRSTAIDGLIPLGAEFIPAAAAPQPTVVVPGVLPGAGNRQLVVTAPDRDAAVAVSLVTPNGLTKRSATAQIPVPAGHTVVVDIDQDLAGVAAAVALSATAPVTAGVRSTLQATVPAGATGVLNRVPIADVAWTAAQPSIGQQWLLPLSGSSAAPALVVLSSTSDPVTVVVSTRSASGAVDERTVEVPADSTVTVTVPVTAGAASIITLARAAGDGLLFAAVTQAGSLPNGPVAAAAIGNDPSTRVAVPLAYPDPQALAGG